MLDPVTAPRPVPLLRRKSRGFTLAELLIVVSLAAILFAGMGAMFATVFRSQSQSLHQQFMQAAATLTVRSLERDLAQATFINNPSVGSDGSFLDGYTNRVWTGTGWVSPVAGGFTHWTYRMCGTELHRWTTTDGSTPSCGTSTNRTILVSNPITISAIGSNIFSRPTYNRIEFTATFTRPATNASPAFSMDVETAVVATAAGVTP